MRYEELLQNFARKSDSGVYELRLAREYLHQHRWGEAVQTANAALYRLEPEMKVQALAVLHDSYARQGQTKLAQQARDMIGEYQHFEGCAPSGGYS